ncbi:MAG TPA: hypothetical protein VEA41_04140 [Salinarimonas sp.]|nr:hypothetical protein [Salinarimonas sp.]
MHPGYISGHWYATIPHGRVEKGAPVLTGYIRFYPFVIHEPITVSHLGCRIITPARGGKLCLCIYSNDAASGGPYGPSLRTPGGFNPEEGEIDTSVAGLVSAPCAGAAINNTLQPGLYWSGIKTDNNYVVVQSMRMDQPNAAYYAGSPNQPNISAGLTQSDFHIPVQCNYGSDWNYYGGPNWSRSGAPRWAHIHMKAA